MSRQSLVVGLVVVAAAVATVGLEAQKESFSGLGMSMGVLSRLSHAKTRSLSPENFTGEKGRAGMATEGTGAKAARDLGQGWKISPSVHIKPGETFVLGEVQGPGAIQHIWMTPTGPWRYSILRFYWDGETTPSIEAPVGDFFAAGWGGYAQLTSIAVCDNPGSAFNSYWEMPFRKSARVTMENIGEQEMTLYYQIDYTLTTVPEDAGYFHAQFRRTNPLPYKAVYTILDNAKGWGHYVGTYLAWGVNNNAWWGEGEIKFYMDGDSDCPTICGTGTEDYFCGSYNFENRETRRYQEFTTPYSGLLQVIRPDGLYQSQQRFALYRWHVMDPIRFDRDLRVTIQALGRVAAISRFRTTSRRWPTGTRPSRTLRSRSCPTRTRSRSSSGARSGTLKPLASQRPSGENSRHCSVASVWVSGITEPLDRAHHGAAASAKSGR